MWYSSKTKSVNYLGLNVQTICFTKKLHHLISYILLCLLCNYLWVSKYFLGFIRYIHHLFLIYLFIYFFWFLLITVTSASLIKWSVKVYVIIIHFLFYILINLLRSEHLIIYRNMLFMNWKNHTGIHRQTLYWNEYSRVLLIIIQINNIVPEATQILRTSIDQLPDVVQTIFSSFFLYLLSQ